MDWVEIVNSNGLATLVLLITGISAFATYYLQKRNEVRDAATILLNEIRNAERTISAIHRTKVINDLAIILTNNSWHKYSHLFAQRLDQDEFTQVSDFYKICEISENYRKLLIQIRNDGISAKARYVQAGLMDLAMKALETNAVDVDPEKRKTFIEMMNKEDFLFSANTPITMMIELISDIPQLTTSSAGAKIKKFSGTT